MGNLGHIYFLLHPTTLSMISGGDSIEVHAEEIPIHPTIMSVFTNISNLPANRLYNNIIMSCWYWWFMEFHFLHQLTVVPHRLAWRTVILSFLPNGWIMSLKLYIQSFALRMTITFHTLGLIIISLNFNSYFSFLSNQNSTIVWWLAGSQEHQLQLQCTTTD